MKARKKKILIVEDDFFMSQSLIEKFTKQGFEVSAAKNGDEGLSMALNDHPDLIMLDIVMPDMNGLVMMKKLRADVWGKAVPIVLLTNLNADDEIMREVVK